MELTWDFLVWAGTGSENEEFTKIIFIFQALILPVPLRILKLIQSSITKFIWAVKRPRTSTIIMQWKKFFGGIGLPNIVLYYQVALLEVIIKCRATDNSRSWEWEQEGIITPFRE